MEAESGGRRRRLIHTGVQSGGGGARARTSGSDKSPRCARGSLGLTEDGGTPLGDLSGGLIDAGRRDGLTTVDTRTELSRLRKDNRVLREERDILKRATVFFAAETR